MYPRRNFDSDARAIFERVNPFEPPQGHEPRQPEPLKIRLLALGMTGVGLFSAYLGLTRPDGIGGGELAFALLCFWLAWITWEKP